MEPELPLVSDEVDPGVEPVVPLLVLPDVPPWSDMVEPLVPVPGVVWD